MHDDGAVIGARVLRHQLFQNVQQHFEAEVAVDVDVDLVAGVPVEPRPLLQLFGRHDPFAMVAVEIAVLHLHQLGDDGAVGEQLDLLRKEHQLFARPRRRDRDLLLGRLQGPGEADAVRNAAPVGEEGRIHRRGRRAENFLVEHPHVRRVERARLVIGGDAVGMQIGDHLPEAEAQPLGRRQHLHHGRDHEIQPALPIMAFGEIDLLAPFALALGFLLGQRRARRWPPN